MTIISIFYARFCGHQEVLQGLAAQCEVRLLDDRFLFHRAARQCGVNPEELGHDLMHGASSKPGRGVQHHRHVAALRSALARELRANADALPVCAGLAAHLIPREVRHVLHVCLVAEFPCRVTRAMDELQLGADMARQRVVADEQSRMAWTDELLGMQPWDHTLYDVIIPMDRKGVDEAVQSILGHARRDIPQPDHADRQALEDFCLAAEVEFALARQGHVVPVRARAGEVELTISRNVIMLSRLKKELQSIAAGVAGVREVSVRLSPQFYQQKMYRDPEPAQSGGLLLVDDEREFVHTLSERLLMREIGSSVVYDGEQALAFVANAPPDVMVLDLKMPGIDGLEVLRQVKDAHPDVAVIILTGHGSREDEQRCMQAGAFAYLQKPVDIDVLTGLLRQARCPQAEQDTCAS